MRMLNARKIAAGFVVFVLWVYLLIGSLNLLGFIVPTLYSVLTFAFSTFWLIPFAVLAMAIAVVGLIAAALYIGELILIGVQFLFGVLGK